MKLRKFLVRVFLLVASLGLASIANAYVETFDSNSANWQYGYGTSFTPGVTTWNAAGGNPSGYISGSASDLYAVWTYVPAPYGDMTGLSLTIDTKVDSTATGNAQFYVGRGGTYFIDGSWAIAADTTWTTHMVSLDSSHFTSWSGVNDHVYTLAQVLQAPTDIGIFFGGSVASGAGHLDVDNFGTVSADPNPTTSVPEPLTALFLGFGLVGVAGAKRKLKG